MTATLLVLLFISIFINAILMWYASRITKTTYAAAITASEIFARLDAYKTHLQDIFELQMFYGDRNLKEIIDHTKDMVSFLNKFSTIYSFIQPEIEEMVLEEDDNEVTTTQTKKEA